MTGSLPPMLEPAQIVMCSRPSLDRPSPVGSLDHPLKRPAATGGSSLWMQEPISKVGLSPRRAES